MFCSQIQIYTCTSETIFHDTVAAFSSQNFLLTTSTHIIIFFATHLIFTFHISIHINVRSSITLIANQRLSYGRTVSNTCIILSPFTKVLFENDVILFLFRIISISISIIIRKYLVVIHKKSEIISFTRFITYP